MTITEFKAYVKTGQALDTDEIHGFMHEMSEEARRVTFRLNTAYHTQDEREFDISLTQGVVYFYQ